ncbi:MAG: hypothetical protein KBG40_05690 [Bacteroidales bacterium]|nr:hypothetical protein [Bacteroidales bacterium]
MPIKYIPVIFIILLLPFSCKKIEKLPPEPAISFISFEIFDTVDILGNSSKGGRLLFDFEDGDGDLGLWPQDYLLESDTINLFLTLLRKSGVDIIPAPADDPLKPSGYRIPYMENSGQNKIQKGTIKITFIYLFYSKSDTIYYEFYIKDRAGHESNIERTCQIPVASNGMYRK